MSVRFQIAVMVYLMVQAVMFGIGVMLVLATPLARDAMAFATLQRRHLAWENGTILPLARQRLSAEDKAELGRRMTARRGGDQRS